MKHITFDKLTIIYTCARLLSTLCPRSHTRRRIVEYNRRVIELAREYSYSSVARLPREYTILYSATENLGTSRSPFYYEKFYTCSIVKGQKFIETTQSYIVYLTSCTIVIPKETIICYVY